MNEVESMELNNVSDGRYQSSLHGVRCSNVESSVKSSSSLLSVLTPFCVSVVNQHFRRTAQKAEIIRIRGSLCPFGIDTKTNT